MGIEYDKKTATFTDFITVDEADALLQWMQTNPKGTVNLADCIHMHAANLQVLMAAKPTISAWPGNALLANWLKGALES
jgi:hypothetical protein